MALKPWKILSSKRNELVKFFNMRTDRAISPRTRIPHDFYVFESADWINVIPLTPEEDVILIRQYRHGIRDFTLEIPGGIMEREDSPEGAAARELYEETGYRAKEMILLGSVHANPAVFNNVCHTFLAKDVYTAGKQELDDKEDIEVVIKPLEEIPRLIKEGKMTHSLILAALYRFYLEYLPSQPG